MKSMIASTSGRQAAAQALHFCHVPRFQTLQGARPNQQYRSTSTCSDAAAQRRRCVSVQGAAPGGTPPAAEHDTSPPASRLSKGSSSKGVVITGASRGLGFAMAQEFLRLGDRVVICGRQAEQLEAAAAALAGQHGSESVHGMVCDVSNPADVDRLASFAVDSLGTVDLWVNNAGQVTVNTLLADVPEEEICSAVSTNVLGSLLGSRAAVRIMRQQPAAPQPAYHVFNLGFSAWGAKFSRSAVTHKATKTALSQLTESLAEELRAAGITSVGVHNLSPGMVLTDLLLNSAASPASFRVFNALAEEPETVAAALVPRMRAIQGSGGSIDYLTPVDAAVRMLTRMSEVINGGRFFDAQGRRVQQEGQAYKENGVRIQL